MHYDELLQKINNHDYESKILYAHNKKEWSIDTVKLRGNFAADLRAYIESELGLKLSDDQSKAIFDKAWEDGHAYGYSAVLTEASNLLDLIQVFIKE